MLAPSLVVLASKVKAVGSEKLGQARPGQTKIKVYWSPFPQTSSFFPFLLPWEVLALSLLSASSDVSGPDAGCPIYLAELFGRRKSFTP